MYCANEERVDPYTLTLRSGHGAISCYSVNTFLNRKAIREKEAINKGNIVVLYIQNIVSVVGLMLQAFYVYTIFFFVFVFSMQGVIWSQERL